MAQAPTQKGEGQRCGKSDRTGIDDKARTELQHDPAALIQKGDVATSGNKGQREGMGPK